jgi:hypothetical protein
MNISSATSSQAYAYIQTQQRIFSNGGEAQEGKGGEKSEPKAAQKSEPSEGGNMISLYA